MPKIKKPPPPGVLAHLVQRQEWRWRARKSIDEIVGLTTGRMQQVK